MRWLFACAVSVVVAGSPEAVWADDKSDCLDGMSHDLRINGCSAVIDRNPNDAIAYYTRAVAYQFKGELDRAISDYSKAIELNPHHASAYDGRGRAYASKGDYTNAVADVTRASEPAHTSAPQPKKITAHDGLLKNTERAPEEVKAATHTTAKIAKREDGLMKKTGWAPKGVKTATRTSSVIVRKASPQVINSPWPAWAPQGNSVN